MQKWIFMQIKNLCQQLLTCYIMRWKNFSRWVKPLIIFQLAVWFIKLVQKMVPIYQFWLWELNNSNEYNSGLQDQGGHRTVVRTLPIFWTISSKSQSRPQQNLAPHWKILSSKSSFKESTILNPLLDSWRNSTKNTIL